MYVLRSILSNFPIDDKESKTTTLRLCVLKVRFSHTQLWCFLAPVFVKDGSDW